jgi:hypothetical protein
LSVFLPGWQLRRSSWYILLIVFGV